VILSLYSVKTVTRNTIWKNDFTLFQTDVETSINSAKIQNAAGGSLITKSESEPNQQVKIQMVDKAITHLNKAIAIHPNYRNAYLLLGNAYFYKGNYQRAVESYNEVLRLNPGNRDGTNNLAVALREQGKYYGEKENDLNKALLYLKQSYEVNPNDNETIRLLGVTYGMGRQHAKALPYFKKLVEVSPNEVSFVKNLSLAYRNTGDNENADYYQRKALQLDPNAFN
jgi:tetratricopeptide (TPR) repeat protein